MNFMLVLHSKHNFGHFFKKFNGTDRHKVYNDRDDHKSYNLCDILHLVCRSIWVVNDAQSYNVSTLNLRKCVYANQYFHNLRQ